MNTNLTSLIVFGCLAGAVLLGRALRRVLPEDHLTADSRDAIKLAMGLMATMTALVLGLLVSSAKGAYDTKRSNPDSRKRRIPRLDASGLRTGSRQCAHEASRSGRKSGSARVAR